MVQAVKRKKDAIAAALRYRAAAIFIFDAKTGEISNSLPLNHSICRSSEEQMGSVAGLRKVSSFRKDATPDSGAASFFARQKPNAFTTRSYLWRSHFVNGRSHRVPFVFSSKLWNSIFTAAPSIDGPIISVCPYLSRAPPLLKSRFYQFQETGGLAYGKAISQESRAL